MTPEEAIAEVNQGKCRPVYLLLGEERYLRKQVVDALRGHVMANAIPGLNDDEFTAGETDIAAALGAVRTLPMMSAQRWVLIRDLDKWEAKEGKKTKESSKAAPLDQLAEYASSPTDSTVLVLLADKLNGRRRLVTLGKKQGFLVQCDSPPKNALPRWLNDRVKERGCKLDHSAAELIAEVAGPDLASLDDVVERLCLFAGDNGLITEETVGDLIPIVRPATVWQLVEAVGRRDVALALAHFSKVYEERDRGLKLLGVLAWSTRQLLRYRAARNEGKSSGEAAKAAGVPPFRARALEQQLGRIPAGMLEHWIETLRDVDLDLKGGSKRPPRAILETALIELCRKQPSA